MLHETNVEHLITCESVIHPVWRFCRWCLSDDSGLTWHRVSTPGAVRAGIGDMPADQWSVIAM